LAKIYGPMSKEIFGPLKRVVDFYYYKGQLCARRMPITCDQPGTPAQTITWNGFKAKTRDLRILTEKDKQGYKWLAQGGHRTWADMFGSEYLHNYNLHPTTLRMVWDLRTRASVGGFQIGLRCSRNGNLPIVFYRGKKFEKPVLWHWEYEQQVLTPPNCRRKVRLVEKWPSYFSFAYNTAPNLQWTPTRPCLISEQVVFRLRDVMYIVTLPFVWTGAFKYVR
jgi:hypothetical protein